MFEFGSSISIVTLYFRVLNFNHFLIHSRVFTALRAFSGPVDVYVSTAAAGPAPPTGAEAPGAIDVTESARACSCYPKKQVPKTC